MNKEQDYASDSDESDEDFRPEAAGDSPASEELSDEAEEEASAKEEEHAKGNKGNAATQNVRRGKKLTKKKSRTKRGSNGKDSDSELEEDGEISAPRRLTRQTDESQLNGGQRSQEKDKLESDEEDKSRSNALWADFLNDVGPPPAKKATNEKEKSNLNSSSSSNGTKESVKSSENKLNGKEANKAEQPKKVTVTQVLDFAGEEVRIQQEVDTSSIKENKAVATSAPKMQPFGRILPGAGAKRAAPSSSSGAGLGSILNQIGKKKKMSVLEKSQMDWKSFKQDEGIDEQLQTFNKGKDGYLERQDFLQRTDLRQFEIEKNLRQTTRRPL